MAQFFRNVLSHFFAIVVAFGLFCFLGLAFLFIMAAAFQPAKPSLPSEAVLVVNLDMQIFDSPDNVNPVQQAISQVQGNETVRITLRQILEALEKAKTDDRIKGVLLAGTFDRGEAMANTIAALTELRGKLLEVRKAGKKIFAYSHTEGLAELYIKSVANEHWMDEFGMFDYRGMAAQIAYLGGTFDRFGIEYQVVRAGKYKSAGEAYAQSEMSPETREALGGLLDDLWLELREGIAEETDLSLEALDTLATNNPMVSAQDAVEMGLVDRTIRFDEVLDELIGFAGYAPEGKTFKQIDLETYVASMHHPMDVLGGHGGNQVVVVYAEGVIVDGNGDAESIGGDRFARLLRKLRKDDNVRAVVLRVNSPGGSATASEAIAREVELTNQKKPVVVSMGGYAASGGYYISAAADTIFSQPTTVTGSIGVIAMIPNVERLATKYDVNFETVETNPHGTLWSPFESKSPEEIGFFDSHVEQTYAAFLNRVAEGRKMEVSAVDAVAQGREWSGVDALERGLVDRIGGLEAAIAHAADLAGIGDDYRIVDLPRPQTLEEAIAEALGSPVPGGDVSLDTLKHQAAPLVEQWEFLRFLSDRYNLYSYSPARISW